MSNAAVQLSAVEDPTVYPVEDDVGEGSLQRFISEELRRIIEAWLASRGTPMFVGADQSFYWKQFDPSEGIAPDVYVLPGAPLGVRVGAWKVWETGLVPSFAMEIVSTDVDKDYVRSPAKYARLGVEELVVFDPDYADDASRARFQVFRKGKRGLLQVEATRGDRVRSKVLGCFLRAVGQGGGIRVRLASGRSGETLVPNETEALASEKTERKRAEAEREHAEAERERAETERERAETERERAESTAKGAMDQLAVERAARLALEAQLAKLRGTKVKSPAKSR